MEYRPIITLTTDFGYTDPFAGIMKGVILGINPLAEIIDITHDIRPQNIIQAAFVIDTSYLHFPRKTIHVVVVDPGVGSERRPLLVATDHHYLIGPDNGVFSRIYKSSESVQVIHVTAEHYFLPQMSSTFHGRDVFAPVAAWLSRGVDIVKFGDPVDDFVTLQIPGSAMTEGDILEGEIVYVDRFGNLMTNIQSKEIDNLFKTGSEGKFQCMVRGKEAPLKDCYSEAEDNELYSLINSFGYLELFVKGGNASSDFGIAIGEKVSLIPPLSE
jgi:S-adenosylmethionine hydrolase